jgi:hypothetical protein
MAYLEGEWTLSLFQTKSDGRKNIFYSVLGVYIVKKMGFIMVFSVDLGNI